MKRIKLFSLAGIFVFGTLIIPTKTEAKTRSGNYINSAGCLVVWEETVFLGIVWSHTETVFCNDDGTPVDFGN